MNGVPRWQLLQQLSNTFYNGLSQSAQQVLTPPQLQLYQRLLLQERGRLRFSIRPCKTSCN